MQRALTVSGLLVAAFIGALLATALRFPIPDTISDWLTPAVALAAVAQAFFTYWALEGVLHARTSATAALTSVAVMERTAEQQMRAYVVVEIGALIDIGSKSIPSAAIRLRNVGQTPAYNVSTKIDVFIAEPGGRTNLADASDVRREAMVIGPGRDRTTRRIADFSMTDEGFAAYTDGPSMIVVGGCTTYDDVFGRTWETTFCHVFDYLSPTGRYHSEHNNAT